MSHLTYSTYKGLGERNREAYHYSQAVRIGDMIDCAGQGGWDPDSGAIPGDLEAELEQAFKNVDMNLKVRQSILPLCLARGLRAELTSISGCV